MRRLLYLTAWGLVLGTFCWVILRLMFMMRDALIAAGVSVDTAAMSAILAFCLVVVILFAIVTAVENKGARKHDDT